MSPSPDGAVDVMLDSAGGSTCRFAGTQDGRAGVDAFSDWLVHWRHNRIAELSRAAYPYRMRPATWRRPPRCPSSAEEIGPLSGNQGSCSPLHGDFLLPVPTSGNKGRASPCLGASCCRYLPLLTSSACGTQFVPKTRGPIPFRRPSLPVTPFSPFLRRGGGRGEGSRPTITLTPSYPTLSHGGLGGRGRVCYHDSRVRRLPS